MAGNDQPRSWWNRLRRSKYSVASVVAYTLFTDMVVYGVVIPVLPLLVVERLHGDSRMVGLLFGCYAFGLLLSTPVFAILSDKYENRRYPMMFGLIGMAVSTVAFAKADTYFWLVVARMAQGVSGGASWTIGLGMLADVFPKERLGTVMGTVLTAHTFGFAVGPPLAGWILEYWGYAVPFYVCAVIASINFLAILWISEPEKHGGMKAAIREQEDQLRTEEEQPTETTPLVSSHAEAKPSIGMIGLLKNWRIMSCVLCVVISASVFSGIEPALPIYLKEQYGASSSTTGFIFVFMVVPAFLSPVIGYLSDNYGRKAISAAGMITMAVISPVLAVKYSSVYQIIPPLMIFGLSSPMTLTPILPEMGEVVHDIGGAAYAQVYALYNMAFSTGMFFGPVAAGFLMELGGFFTVMAAFGVALLVCSPIMVDWPGLWQRIMSSRHD
ncbi:unnamed protein product [Umbelopsis ramanniana]